ncbi:hypothetical protein EWM64_g8588 [Hericium alpestre]|uniref:Uncharacterized protein n=1 Tax=Hericium alpestre TaxID=135208 RepID=A0A4Y9ZMD5_9AGAM|nr:hypothetical protein EWM64_g8588 [Hericium alpestre]
MPLVIDDATKSAPDPNANDEDQPAPVADDVDPLERLLEDLEEHNMAVFVGRRDIFTVEAGCDGLEDGDAVDLTDPGLLDLLSDIPVSGVAHGDMDMPEMPEAQEAACTKFQKKNFDPNTVNFSLD